MEPYRAIISSDWNECLAPCGPFDYIAFTFPDLKPALDDIFKRYTGNHITLDDAMYQVGDCLPEPIGISQMDAYLEAAFQMYTGVANLMRWCQSQNILFMINTTGMIGYFQRVFARGLLPRVPVLSANPMVRYHGMESDPDFIYDLLEIQDKAKNTAAVAGKYNISADKIILMGDSGGDGPHFGWGSKNGAYLIGSMTKPSLKSYCQSRGIHIDLHFGLTYDEGVEKDPQKEMQSDFTELSFRIAEFLKP